MCTTYTWLAYSWPDPDHASRVPSRAASSTPRGAPPPLSGMTRAASPTGPRRPRRARHWVGLAIVGVQMAAWCLVGALLMHRGVTNMRRRDAAPLSPSPPLHPPQRHNGSQAGDDALLSPPGSPPPLQPDPEGPRETPAAAPKEDDDRDDVLDDDRDDAVDDVTATPDYDTNNSVWPEDSRRDHSNRWSSSYLPARPPLGPFAPREDKPGPSLGGPGLPASSPGSSSHSGARAAGTGAATAVVMVTVGGVMLVVGPAFMLIKIMDVYQRQKRLTKVRP